MLQYRATVLGSTLSFRRLAQYPQALGYFSNFTPFWRRLLHTTTLTDLATLQSILNPFLASGGYPIALEIPVRLEEFRGLEIFAAVRQFRQHTAASLAVSRLYRDSIIQFPTESCRTIERWPSGVEGFIIYCDL